MCQIHEISRKETDCKQKSGWSSNWDTEVNEVKPPLNQTLCILVKLTQDLRPHFQSVLYFFPQVHTPWKLLPIWDLWSRLFVVTWDFFFPCSPQSHHSTLPEQHQSLQKSFYYIKPAQHVLRHCRPYLQQWTLILQPLYGAQFGVSTEGSQALLCRAQFRAICEWLHGPPSQLTYSSCGKIQNWKSQN